VALKIKKAIETYGEEGGEEDVKTWMRARGEDREFVSYTRIKKHNIKDKSNCPSNASRYFSFLHELFIVTCGCS
jgi:hypothetical protein